MKILIFALLFCVFYLQYAGHFEEDGMPKLNRISAAIDDANVKIAALEQTNRDLELEIYDLIHGYEAIEELARSKMGMIKQEERFFRVLDLDERNKVSED